MWFQTDGDRACSWASAPNIAGRSTPTCCSAWSSTRRPTLRAGSRTRRRPAVEEPAAAEGKAAFLSAIVRQLPSGPRHAGAGDLCPRPDAPDEPRHARLRDDPKHARGIAALDRRPAGGQAGLPDAGLRPDRSRARRASSTISARSAEGRIAWPSPSDDAETAEPALDGGAPRLGRRRSTTRRSASCTSLMAVVFLVIGGCEALLMRWQLFCPAQRRSSARTRSIRCSRCTAPRWCSSWGCRS